MKVFEFNGEFLPSLLHEELNAAGVNVTGVTCTEVDSKVVAVQVICEGRVSKKVISEVAAAHTPEREPPKPKRKPKPKAKKKR